MTKRWALNLLLALLLVLLGWAIRHQLAATRSPPTLAGTGTAEPHLIEITRAGEPTILIERGGSGWRMRTPWIVDADAGRVAALLAIRGAPLQRTLPAEMTDLAALGLDPIRLRLRLDTSDFAIGATDPVAHWRYVLSDGMVHLIEDRFHHLLTAPPIDVVSRDLLPRDPKPAFAILEDVPLSGETLGRLEALIAERLEPFSGDSIGRRLEFRAMDGTRVPYLISDDARRWSRLDLNLTYVLAEPPALITDPGAIDPTPPPPGGNRDIMATEPAPDGTDGALRDPDGLDPDELDHKTLDPNALDQALDAGGMTDPFDTSDSLMDPDAPLSGDLPLGPPPAVHLRPHDPTHEVMLDPNNLDNLDNTMLREPPEGFGLDPFAPDPVQPDQGDP